MCGITGIIDLREKRTVDLPLIKAMNDSQHHRGPDQEGIFSAPGVALAHKRLSIIDLASGQQPMVSPDNQEILVFNGEIYNYLELRKTLIAQGIKFTTHSDTEVILHGWRVWGPDVVSKLRGMFAFAIWDSKQHQLFLARDRLGIKPLFYSWLDNGFFIFGSELKSLLKHPRLDKSIRPESVEEYFAYGYIPEPATIFRKVHKLAPGHVLHVEANSSDITQRQYWDVPLTANTSVGNEADVLQTIREKILDAVQVRLVAEVPLGAFLSGGVDSSAVVAMMAQADPNPVKTCSISFDVADFDEAHYAQMVAERYHTEHEVKTVDHDDFSLVDKLAALYDEPYADSSAIPTYRVCELARQKVTVALSGDGGDENFAGYRRYRWHMIEEGVRNRMPLMWRRPIFGFLGSVYPKADWAPRIFRAKATFQAMARDSIEAYFHSVSILDDERRSQLFDNQFKRSLNGYQAHEVLKYHAERAPAEDMLSMIQYLDMKTYLVGDILTKVDRASMAHALEVRVPLLDHQLVEYVAALPTEYKLRGSEGKYALKKAFEPLLPHEVLYRQKMGFAVPLAKWFRGPLKDRLESRLLGEQMLSTGYFNRNNLRTLIDQHLSGRRDNSAPLWTLLMFDAFLKEQQI